MNVIDLISRETARNVSSVNRGRGSEEIADLVAFPHLHGTIGIRQNARGRQIVAPALRDEIGIMEKVLGRLMRGQMVGMAKGMHLTVLPAARASAASPGDREDREVQGGTVLLRGIDLPRAAVVRLKAVRKKNEVPATGGDPQPSVNSTPKSLSLINGLSSDDWLKN
ncbi:hypothetical protein [Schlesneria sp. T3-172]|uniref:hypothetical protein n=1 Tax=Schlesneria sphaerica TaxID=3373610 RepID=UPI0037C793BC